MIFLSLFIIIITVLSSLPFTPWFKPIKDVLGGSYLPLYVSSFILIAALIFPKQKKEQLDNKNAWFLIGNGSVFVLLPILFTIVVAYSTIFPEASLFSLLLPSHNKDFLHNGNKLIVLITWVFLPAIAEESFFRGRFLIWLHKKTGNIAIFISAILFALSHGTTVQAIFAIPIGLLLGVVRLKSKSLYICITIHCLHNIVFLLANELVSMPFFLLFSSLFGLWAIAIGACLLKAENYKIPVVVKKKIISSFSVMSLGVITSFLFFQDNYLSLWSKAVIKQACFFHNENEVLKRLECYNNKNFFIEQKKDHLVETLKSSEFKKVDKIFRMMVILKEEDAIIWGKQNSSIDRLFSFLLNEQNNKANASFKKAGINLAQKYPNEFIEFAVYQPLVFKEWLLIPETSDIISKIISATSAIKRRQFLFHIRGEHDIDTALKILLRIDREKITQQDKFYFHKNAKHPELLLNDLEKHNKKAADIWRIIK